MVGIKGGLTDGENCRETSVSYTHLSDVPMRWVLPIILTVHLMQISSISVYQIQ